MAQAPQEALIAELPELAHVRRLLGSKALTLQGYEALLGLLAEGNLWQALKPDAENFWRGLAFQTQAALQLVPPREAGPLFRKLGPLWEAVIGAYHGPDLLSLAGIRLFRTGHGLVVESAFKHLHLRLYRLRDRLLFEAMARGTLKGNKGEGYVAGICQAREVWVTQRQCEFLSRAGLMLGCGGVRRAVAAAQGVPLTDLDGPFQAALTPFASVIGEGAFLGFDWLIERQAAACRARAALFWQQDDEPRQLEVCGIAEADSLLRMGRGLLAQRLLPELSDRLAVRYDQGIADRLVKAHEAALCAQLSRILAKGVPLVGEQGVQFVVEGAVEKVLHETLIDGRSLAAWAAD